MRRRDLDRRLTWLRTLVLLSCAACLAGGLPRPAWAAETEFEAATLHEVESGRVEMAALGADMKAFVAGLDPDQQRDALYAFDDDERFDLRLAPLGLEGLRISDMSEAQWDGLESLLGRVLSPVGLDKMNTIRSLEREVAETENGFFGFLMNRMRDARRYFLSVYGTPSESEPWGLRFDGHHLSLNWTAVPGQPLSATPLFLGGQPRVVPEPLERAGLRVLADEEEFAVTFLNALTAAQRDRARIPWRKGSGIRRPMSIAGEVDLELPKADGLRRAALDDDGRARLDALVEVHLANFVPAIAERYRAGYLGAAATTSLVFASAGEPSEPISAGRALYYRIQAGAFLIEFDDTAEAADHVHVVLRDTASDFGRDALAEHRSKHH